MQSPHAVGHTAECWTILCSVIFLWGILGMCPRTGKQITQGGRSSSPPSSRTGPVYCHCGLAWLLIFLVGYVRRGQWVDIDSKSTSTMRTATTVERVWLCIVLWFFFQIDQPGSDAKSKDNFPACSASSVENVEYRFSRL